MRGNALVAVVLVVVFGAAVVLFVFSGAGPHVRITAPQKDSTVGGIVQITGEASGGSGVAGVRIRIDGGNWSAAKDTSDNQDWASWAASWDTTNVTDGAHRITAGAWDTSEQTGESSVDVKVANPPWVRILSPLNESTTFGIARVEGESGDPSLGGTVEFVEVTVDPSPGGGTSWERATPTTPDWATWSYEWNTTRTNTGIHAFAARAFDGALYSEPWVNEYYVDNRPFVQITHPRANLTPPESVYWFYLIHGTAGARIGGDPVRNVQVRIDDGGWNNTTDVSPDGSWSEWAYQWDTTNYSDGEHVVCARSWDGDQFSATVCSSGYVSNNCGAPPSVAIADPTDGETVRGNVLVHGNASSDCCGVWLVQVRVGSGDWEGAADTSQDGSWRTWAMPWDTTWRDDGCVDLTARAWDGTVFSAVYRVNVCVDNNNVQPTVSFDDLTNGTAVHGLHLLTGRAGRAPGVQLVQVSVDDGPWWRATDTGQVRPWTTWAFEWNTSAVQNGDHNVCARALDGELYSEPVCVTLNVDNDPQTAITGAQLIQTSILALGLPSWLSSVLIWLLDAGYVPVLVVSLVPAVLVWLRSHGYLGR